jgi:hypothetical protein
MAILSCWQCTGCEECVHYMVCIYFLSCHKLSSVEVFIQPDQVAPGECLCGHLEAAHAQEQEPLTASLPPKGSCPCTGCIKFNAVNIFQYLIQRSTQMFSGLKWTGLHVPSASRQDVGSPTLAISIYPQLCHPLHPPQVNTVKSPPCLLQGQLGAGLSPTRPKPQMITEL